MVFQPRNKGAQSINVASLVDQVADAVKKRMASPASAPDAQQDAPSSGSVASKIDHTLLKPDATRGDIKRVCDEARQYHFATVCVNSSHIALAAELLKGSGVKPIAVVGFPFGAAVTSAKVFETQEAIRNGAQEIDMVINIGALKGRDYALVLDDIRQVVEASRPYPVKVILETSSLEHEEKVIGCSLSKAAGAAFVKTSTGYASGGATVSDIALMRKIVGPDMGVKASGGVRTYEDAINMIAAGANRIGASSSVAIVNEEKAGGRKTGAAAAFSSAASSYSRKFTSGGGPKGAPAKSEKKPPKGGLY
ncbi:MAG: deoxyribose-phosphate aldolase [Deltaproteobacteria bacterium]|nr:deoxyribose-phosphate aldolase [Deltaproteobacteria bacterium]